MPLVKADFSQSVVAEVTPQSANWKYVGFSALVLADGEQHHVFTPNNRELCLTLLCGFADVQVGNQTFSHIGQRQSVFDDQSPFAIYVPPNQEIIITSHGKTEWGLSSAPATGRYPTRLIRPEEMKRSVRGKNNNTRYICDILPEQADMAESLLVVEVITPANNTSSYPPHKHDQATDNETLLEETYYHRLNPAQGFAFQRVYTDDRSIDECFAVENHDVVCVPKGYHPCGTVYGYDLYYLNTMAGPERRWAFYNEPQHEWISNQ